MMDKLKLIFGDKTLSYIGIPIFMLSLLAMIILPLPALFLDIFFTFNIVLAIIIMLVSVSIKRPLEFSIFPTVLLLATLLRLAMNVASTRVVLQYGHESPDAAGKVIEAFGSVVIGGNYIVGSVVFMILMIVNFMVITKGGERISEVGARFTLDAMPGKQMSIDADLNAGLIDQAQAKSRREEVALEADFYGSMDGASKFVKGDAVAGLLILIINLVGGISIGVFQHGLSFSEAVGVYGVLSIGDGLVAQIPSLLLAVSAAIIVTRVSETDDDMSELIQKQLLASPAALATASAIMLIIGLVPGMPTFAFVSFAAVLGYAAWTQQKQQAEIPDPVAENQLQQFLRPVENPLAWEDLPSTDLLKLELGYQLVYLVDRERGAELVQRIRGVRQTLSEQAGFLLPEVRVKDNLSLKPTQYAIYLNGVKMGGGDIPANKLLAINTGELFGDINGIITKEPAYGMDAVWIEPDNKSKALNLGYSVVDAATVVGTHLSKIMRESLAELLNHDDVPYLLQRLSRQSPKLSDVLVSKLNFNQQLKIYRQLLNDQISLTDIRTIGQTLLDSSEVTKDPILLAADVRCALRRNILSGLIGTEQLISVFTLAEELENTLVQAFSQSQRTGGVPLDSIPIDPQLLAQLQARMPMVKDQMIMAGYPPILLVLPQLRPLLARYARTFSKGLHVLSFNEIPDDKQIDVKGVLG